MTPDHAAHQAADREHEEPWQPIETAPKDGRWFWVKRVPAYKDSITESVFRWDASHGMWFAGTGWWSQFPGTFTHWKPLPSDDLYVRAFLAGAQWQQKEYDAQERQLDTAFNALMTAVTDEETDLHEAEEQERHLSRVEPLINSPTPATGSTASPDTGESPQRGKS